MLELLYEISFIDQCLRIFLLEQPFFEGPARQEIDYKTSIWHGLRRSGDGFEVSVVDGPLNNSLANCQKDTNELQTL